MRVSELFEATLVEGFSIKLKDGTWYSEERPTLGPVKGGNSQVRVFKSMDDADDFLIKQQNSKFGARKFEDAEIKRSPKLKEGYDTSLKNREHFDDFEEWKKAVRQAGADVFKKTANIDGAMGHDGECGEFYKTRSEGWLVDKWSKPVKEGKEFGAYYYEQLAKKLPGGLKDEEVIDAGFQQAIKDLGKVKAHHYFYYDEDFRSDLASSYEWWQKNKDSVKEGIGQKSWRQKVRTQHGDDVKFFDDTVHQRVIAQKGANKHIVATFDRKSGKPTIFSEGINGEYRAVHNRSGIAKKFKWIDGDWEKPSEVKAWLGDSSNPQADKAAAKRTREFEKSIKPAREVKPAVDLQKVYNIVINAIGDSFPDGDPIDHIIPALRRLGVPRDDAMEYADKALKKHGGKSEKKGVYGYLAQMWDDMAGDAMHDANAMLKQNPKYDQRSPFVEIEDGKAVKNSNPWKS